MDKMSSPPSRRLHRAWVWPVVLAVGIFIASTRSQIAEPDISHIDKVAHFGVYGLLATLLCRLGRGWRARTTLGIPSPDDFGRVRLRCELLEADETRFSTDVDAPENQLFFYERDLGEGGRVLIGVGAR